MEKAGLGETTLGQWFMWLAIIGIVLLILIYGRPFLLPIVVAFLVFTVFSGAIDKVSRIRLGRMTLPYWLAATAGLFVFAVVMFLLYVIISGEILLIVAEWPRILERLQGLIASLSEWFGEDLGEAIRATYGEFNIVASIRGIVSPAGFAITAIVVVLLYVAFMFVERSYFQGKVERLFPDPARAGQVKDVARQIIKSVHRYLLLKTLLSAGNTLAAYALMKLVGLEFAETWALLTFFLNFIPKIGSITATVIPSVFALLQFQEFQAVLFVAGGLTLVHMVTGEVVEPMVMGRTLNLSSLVIMLALTFWAMVWGIVGTFLAVPLMVVILIICSKVPMLRPVAILLSSDGDLDTEGPPAEPAKARSPRRKAS
jgi:predicted PurR-regulated permease PerM